MKITYYDTATGCIKYAGASQRHPAPSFLAEMPGVGFVLGDYDRLTHYVDITTTELVDLVKLDEDELPVLAPIMVDEPVMEQVETLDPFGQPTGLYVQQPTGETVERDTGAREQVLESVALHVPTAKTPSSLSASYNYTIGGADLSLTVGNGTKVIDKAPDGSLLSQETVADGDITREYTVAGTYTVEVEEVQHLPITISIVVSA